MISLRKYWVFLSLCVSFVHCGPTVSAPADATSGDVAGSLDGTLPSGDASAASCTFNRDCPPAERCECNEQTGCFCALGTRGPGAIAAPCRDGNDCVSALCVEGPSGAFVCSDSCTGPMDCVALLPRCVRIPTLGSICARALSDASSADASPDATCDGPCPQTALNGRFGARAAGFNRAQHGVEGTDGVHIEAHFGGRPECPSMSSPTPDRTLVLTGIRARMDNTPQTFADGVRATLLDFSGALTASPLLRATAVTITPRSVQRGREVVYDVSATFDGGMIEGQVVAPHCASLNSP
ncbi:MAG: hypothetical protein Q8Q09_25590 [Deltaproteobacteria bacterium]|nr:hypothetical protein [Deltaproteobacteria bacterium]